MTTQDLKQIEKLLDKKHKDIPTNDDMDKKLAKLKDDLEDTIGALGRQLHEDLAPADEFSELEKRVERIEDDLQIS